MGVLKRLQAMGYTEEDLEQSNPYNQWMKEVDVDLNAINSETWIEFLDGGNAAAEGWGIFDADDGIELQRIDEAGIFRDDREAWLYVWARAKEGRHLHQRALNHLRTTSPDEFDAVAIYCSSRDKWFADQAAAKRRFEESEAGKKMEAALAEATALDAQYAETFESEGYSRDLRALVIAARDAWICLSDQDESIDYDTFVALGKALDQFEPWLDGEDSQDPRENGWVDDRGRP